MFAEPVPVSDGKSQAKDNNNQAGVMPRRGAFI
jgi:hypothetical protein